MPAKFHRSWQFLRASKNVPTGFTLLELMLVLTILVILGSMIVPALDRIMDRQRLRGAAEEMRLAWDSARLTALRTGQAQVFRCEIGSHGYVIEPLILQDDANTAAAGATMLVGGVAVEAASTSFGMTTTTANTGDFAKSLDESIAFVSCVVAGDLRAYSLAQSGETASVDLTTVNHSVIFYPDGSTSNAEVRVQNEAGESAGVQIRGITGHTKLLPFVGVGAATP